MAGGPQFGDQPQMSANRLPGIATPAIWNATWRRWVTTFAPIFISFLFRLVSRRGTTAICVRREKAALSSGCKSHPANAPAGSNRSSHGGDEMAEAFGVAGHV